MNYVDLHVHSDASDGTLPPEEVVSAAAAAGLKAIALTDHDTVAGIVRARAAAERLPLELAPGIELSCVWQGTEIHILGLFIDETCPALQQALDRLVQIRKRRNLQMLARFQEDGFAITLEDLRSGNPDTVITRAHFARILTEKGYAPSMDAAFREYLQYGGRYCARKEMVTPEEAMELLRTADAWPCLAHPVQYHLDGPQLEALIRHLKQQGLRGLEVYHPSQTPGQSCQLREMTRSHGLLPSGGSDFHGSNKPDIRLGVGRGGLRVSQALLEDIRKDHAAKSR